MENAIIVEIKNDPQTLRALIVAVGRRIHRRFEHVEFDECVGWGQLGIMHAIHEFDASRPREVNFSVVWSSIIRRAVYRAIDEMRVGGILARVRSGKFYGHSVAAEPIKNYGDIPDYREHEAVVEKDSDDVKKIMAKFKELLTPRQYQVIHLRYVKQFSFLAISKRTRVSRATVYQCRDRAISNLNKRYISAN